MKGVERLVRRLVEQRFPAQGYVGVIDAGDAVRHEVEIL
jgi:hypothetical protein